MNDAKTIATLQGAGFSNEEIGAHIQPDVSTLRSAGFTDEEIGDHFGLLKAQPLDPAPLQKYATEKMTEAAGFKSASPEFNPSEGPETEFTFAQAMESFFDNKVDAVVAGGQASILGMVLRDSMPDKILPENASTVDRILSQSAMIASDIPFYWAGFALTAPAGGPTPFGVAIGVGGSFALPAGIREVLVNAYTNGKIDTGQEFWEVLSAAMIETYKGFVTGTAVGAVGPAAGAATAARIGLRGIAPVAATVASRTAEVAAMVSVQSALEAEQSILEGRMPSVPDLRDFTDAGAVIMTLALGKRLGRMGKHATRSMLNTYRTTGKTPGKVIEDAESNPTIKEDIASTNHNETPRAYKEVRPGTPEEVVASVDAKLGKKTADVLRGKDKQQSGKIETVSGESFSKISKKELNSTGDDNLSPWLEADGSVVHTGGDHLSLPIARGFGGGREHSLATGSLRATFHTQGSNAADKPFVLLHMFEGQSLTLEQFKTVKEFVDATGAKVELGIQKGTSDTKNPTFNEVGLEGLPVATAAPPPGGGKPKLSDPPVFPKEKPSLATLPETADALALWHIREGRDPGKLDPRRVSAWEEMGLVRRKRDGTLEVTREGGEELSFWIDRASSVPEPDPEVQRMMDVSGHSEVDIIENLSALESVKKHISFGGEKGPRKTLRQHWNSLYANWFQLQAPLGDAIRLMAEGAPIPLVENAAKLAQLEAGVTGVAQSWLEFATRSFETNERIGRPLKEILKPLEGDLDTFAAYLVARRAVEVGTMKKKVKNAAGETVEVEVSKSGIDIELAGRAVAEGRAKYEAIANEVVEFQGHVLAWLRDSGVLTPEAHDLMRAAGKEYVPLYRVFEEGSEITSKGQGRHAKNPIFRLRGSDLTIVDPLESIIKNTYLYIAVAARNQIGLQLTNLAERSGHGEIAKKIKQVQRPIGVKKNEIQRAIKKWADGKELTEPEAKLLESFAETEFTVFRPNGMRPGDNQIAVFNKGQKSIWEIDPEVYRTFAAGNGPTNTLLWRIMTAPARTMRAGTVLNPGFGVTNPIRDQFTAFLISENKLRLFIDAASGLASVARKDTAFQDWMAAGGAGASLVSLDRLYLRKGMQEMLNSRIRNTARNVVRNPIEMLRILSEFSESMTRVGEFKRAGGVGAGKEQMLKAALDSRNVSLDFAQMGTQAMVVNKIIPFFAANLNGDAALVRAFRDHPVRSMAKVTVSITIPSVLLHLHHRDKEWYKALNQWEKDIFWVFKVGGTDAYGDGTVWRIPKPHQLGIIFGTGAEHIVDMMMDDDPQAFDDFQSSIISATNPWSVPSFASPVIESYSNHKFFFDTPLVPGYAEPLLPAYRQTPYTLELSKWIARTLDEFGVGNNRFTSPIAIENFVTAWSGGLGRHVMRGLDAVLRKLPDGAGGTILEDTVRPSGQWIADTPFLRAFYIRTPSMSTQQIQDFYSRYQDRAEVLNTLKSKVSSGDARSVQELRDRFGDTAFINDDDTYNSMNEFASLSRKTAHPLFPGTADEKQQLIDKYAMSMHKMAVIGIRKLDAIEEKQKEITESLERMK